MIDEKREAEIDKYREVYKLPNYKMGGARMQHAQEILESLPVRGYYLDIGCGRGEMLDFADSIEFEFTGGIETVEYLCGKNGVVKGLATDIPVDDKSYHVVSMLDVIEHLLPEDTIPALEELGRVAIDYILVTANNRTSKSLGVELHINIRDYQEWDNIFRSVYPDAEVTWLPKMYNNISETWLIKL